ncbi:MAG TPA: ATP-binding cassette domain-containing protein [Clostridiales bacterium]|nr:ATP-binding cassette domain-containing protein [Clostridiales bacterium]
MEETIIKAENISFTYEDGTNALKGIDLEIKKGRKIAFLGANGSGKSTFFLCLNGIHQPEAGTLYYKGEPYRYKKDFLLQLRSKVGIVFQDPDRQLFSASVRQEISFGAMNLGLATEEVKARVNRSIEELEITPFQEKPTHFLSGGQKKQVAIADILVMDPEVIVLDEPAAALDPKHTAIVNHHIDQLAKKGITVLISTHDVDHAYAWADEVILFHEGNILKSGTPRTVFSDEKTLIATNLQKPSALRLFDDLCAKGLLDPALPPPRNLAELELYIHDISKRSAAL